MIKYICKRCNIESSHSICPSCGERAEMKGSALYQCPHCNIPTFDEVCPICGTRGKQVATDLRPVFPKERLLIEIMMGCPLKYKDSSVWKAANFYFADGVKLPFTVSDAKAFTPDYLRTMLTRYEEENKKNSFDLYLTRFLQANRSRYDFLVSEATQYIREAASGYGATDMYVSFSGGKDSTVVSSLVMRAMSDQRILHVYGDTTLEFPETLAYVKRFRKEHPATPFLISRNSDKDFYQLCDTFGPPSRVMRYCCTIFKTGAIQRKISSIFKGKTRILMFNGLRRSESTARSKYDRDSEETKIALQKAASPIIDWLDFDVWLYMLTTGIDFNDAYREGYSRVGCWCCPNNSAWSELLSSIYMPEQYEKFHSMLIEFAKKIGKPDPEDYVAEGGWKARQGGNGLSYSQTSVLKFEPCVLQENTLNFELQKPITEGLYELFKPFGYLNFEMGNARLGEVFVIDRNAKPQLKLQGRIGSRTLKVSMLDKNAGHAASLRALEDKIKCQITKYQMCMGCLACESVCKQGAISIIADREGMRSYHISDQKCVRCGLCIGHFDGGCYIRRVMTIKR